MQGFLQNAAKQLEDASDKAAAAAESKFGKGVADNVRKAGHEAGEKVAHMDVNQIEGELKQHGFNIPNLTSGGKAAVPTSANPTTGGVVTKAGAIPAAGEAGPGAANPLTGSGAAEGATKPADNHAAPATEPAK